MAMDATAGSPERVGHCTFCDLVHGAGEVSVCYEDSDAIAFMDIQPVNAGHVLVVPREHYESIFDVPRELGVHLFDVTMRLATTIRRVTGCEDMNLVVNSGEAAGQDEPHYHVHIIPRRAGDGFDVPLPFGGSQMPDRTLLDAMAARIIAELRDPVGRSGTRSAGGGVGEPSTRKTAAFRASGALADQGSDEEREIPRDLHREEQREEQREETPAAAGSPAGAEAVQPMAGEGPHGELQLEDAPASS